MCRGSNIFIVPLAENDRGEVTAIRLLSRPKNSHMKRGIAMHTNNRGVRCFRPELKTAQI